MKRSLETSYLFLEPKVLVGVVVFLAFRCLNCYVMDIILVTVVCGQNNLISNLVIEA